MHQVDEPRESWGPRAWPRRFDERVLIPALYRIVLRRTADKEGLAHYIDELDAGLLSRIGIASSMRRSEERNQKSGHRRAVRKCYRRLPGEAVRRFRRPADILDVVFQAFLERPPTPSERHRWAAFVRRGSLRRVLELPGHIVNTTDFGRVHRLHPEPVWAIHESRVQMVEGCIPAAETVIDLGGAAHRAAEGALLMMGYPFTPARITIVDLDPNARLYLEGWSSRRGAETVRETVTHDGVRVDYHYGSMSDLSPFPDDSVDLVFCGESIEHVWPQDADRAISEAFRVLRPGGSFCLDTPNAQLTKLQSPHGLIHPEHKYEYEVEELRAKIVHAGFEIVRELGVCAMPRSRSSGAFDELEMLDGIGLCDDPRDGYLLFIEARKPS